MRPNRLELRAVRELLLNFHDRVGCGTRSFHDQLRVAETRNDLPLQDSTIVQALGCMLADDTSILYQRRRSLAG